jgi:hypothetical protein
MPFLGLLADCWPEGLLSLSLFDSKVPALDVAGAPDGRANRSIQVEECTPMTPMTAGVANRPYSRVSL